MLNRLFIQNFALIDRLEIDLHPGFNVMTGETGAGKSIIIDAVDIAMGGQGLTEFIRSGEDKALVEAGFDITENQSVRDVLQQYGLLPEEEESLILSRELVKTGKNLCRINGRQVNLSLYREVAKNLVDIYGQHHQQSLLDPQKHIELLDEYGGEVLISLKERLFLVYEQLASLQSRIKAMEAGEKEQARMSDIYKFQIDEIEKCKLQPDEEQALEEEKNILAHAEKLTVLADTVYELLYDGGKQKAVTDLLHEAVRSCKEAGNIDENVRPIGETLETSLYQIEEAARDIKAYSEKIESDPYRLEGVENRLNLIRQLKKKYGDSIREILEYKGKVCASLDLLAHHDEELAAAKKELAEAERQYQDAAGELSITRKKAAAGLTTEITRELKELNMPHISFEVQILQKNVPAGNGIDEVEFLISPNKGEPLKPLTKIVSGGEVSRIMLAFKAILARMDSVSTLIFDEVDTGVGGNALQAIAQKLSLIGRDRQVICVTHSPQVAGHGDNHYRAVKSVNKERTITQVEELSPGDRVDEIARMLAGGTITPVTRKHAEEILKKT